MQADLGAGTASFSLRDFATDDYHDIVNSLADGPSVSSTVSFDLQWRGPGARVGVDASNNSAQGWGGSFARTGATIEWSAHQPGFDFVSDPGFTSTNAFALLGAERNGAFFHGAQGYRFVGSDGGIFSFGGAAFKGSTGAISLNKPIVGMAPTPSGQGYWLVASDGGVFAFGDAGSLGSGVGRFSVPVVGMAATPTGNGYWILGSDGSVVAVGDAPSRTPAVPLRLAAPAVGIVSTPTGQGYWIAGADGGVFTFGDATFKGSAGSLHLARPVVGIGATPTGQGYWLTGSDGGVFAYGDATFLGSTGATRLNKPVVGIAAL